MPTPPKPISVNGHMSWGMRVRSRIDSAKIVERLQRVACGDEEATQSSINAARILLNKTLPDIKPMEVQQGDGGNAKTITNDKLFELIEGQCERIDDKS